MLRLPFTLKRSLPTSSVSPELLNFQRKVLKINNKKREMHENCYVRNRINISCLNWKIQFVVVLY